MRKWPNIIKDMVVTEPDQVWVSDITYIKTEKENCYLNMITDAYSRKIVGYAMDNTMQTESMIKALEMAAKQKKSIQISVLYIILTGVYNIAVRNMLN